MLRLRMFAGPRRPVAGTIRRRTRPQPERAAPAPRRSRRAARRGRRSRRARRTPPGSPAIPLRHAAQSRPARPRPADPAGAARGAGGEARRAVVRRRPGHGACPGGAGRLPVESRAGAHQRAGQRRFHAGAGFHRDRRSTAARRALLRSAAVGDAQFLRRDVRWSVGGGRHRLPGPERFDDSAQWTSPTTAPGRGGRWTIELLEAYFRDSIGLLDSTATERGLDLSRFDSYIVAHPGSDLQNDINGDSPNDLPTFFITLADSILVQGAHEIRKRVGVPRNIVAGRTHRRHLGRPVPRVSAHQLGLPDWYDTYFGLPVVGEWSLMDFGQCADDRVSRSRAATRSSSATG